MIVITLIFLTVFATEFAAYLWHRYGTHTNIFPSIRRSHQKHHRADLTHQSHEDFLWVLIIVTGLGILIFSSSGFAGDYLNIGVVYLTMVIVFGWNWYIHTSYHIPNHWLNKYEWFRNDKRSHFQHHINPRTNYGIASHFADIIFGTYHLPPVDISDITEMIPKF